MEKNVKMDATKYYIIKQFKLIFFINYINV